MWQRNSGDRLTKNPTQPSVARMWRKFVSYLMKLGLASRIVCLGATVLARFPVQTNSRTIRSQTDDFRPQGTSACILRSQTACLAVLHCIRSCGLACLAWTEVLASRGYMRSRIQPLSIASRMERRQEKWCLRVSQQIERRVACSCARGGRKSAHGQFHSPRHGRNAADAAVGRGTGASTAATCGGSVANRMSGYSPKSAGLPLPRPNFLPYVWKRRRPKIAVRHT